MSGITDTPPVATVSAALQASVREVLAGLDDDAAHAYLADTIYLERRRFAEDRDKLSDADRAEQRAVEAAFMKRFVTKMLHRDV